MCLNYAHTAADLGDEQEMLQRAVFATFGMSDSRHLPLVEPESRPIQLWGHRGPVIYGQSRASWIRPCVWGLFRLVESGLYIGGKARVQISDYEGEMASGLQGIVLRKIGSEWFAVNGSKVQFPGSPEGA